jgi:hypothetical protein
VLLAGRDGLASEYDDLLAGRAAVVQWDAKLVVSQNQPG